MIVRILHQTCKKNILFNLGLMKRTLKTGLNVANELHQKTCSELFNTFIFSCVSIELHLK